jgi:hypothetical protein
MVGTNGADHLVDYSSVSLSAWGAPTADLSVGSNKITNLADGTVSTDAAAFGQVSVKANSAITISTTAPLSGGGDLSANRTIAIADGTTSVKGAVQLTDSTSSTSTTTAATPNSVKTAYDLASTSGLINPISSFYYKTPTSSQSTTATAVINTTNYTPITFSQTVTLDRIAIVSGSSFSGSASVRLGIFANSNGRPGNLILDAGTVAPTAASSSYAITISQSLSAGIYWVAMNTITAATTNTYYGSSSGTNTFNPLIGGAVVSLPGSAGLMGFTQAYTATSSFTNAGSVTATGAGVFTYVRVA